MRRKIVVGNWKMYKTLPEAVQDYQAFAQATQGLKDKLDLGFAAPALTLAALAEKSSAGVKVYAQNCHWEKEGAFTGEISVPMLKHINLNGSVIGHSERRQYFGETNASAGKRAGALVKQGLEAIFCIGETLAERQKGLLKDILRAQMFEAFDAAEIKSFADFGWMNGSNAPLLSIAYEPVWAIGTGLAATATEAQEAHLLIRNFLGERFGAENAQKMRILYGGSVNLTNVASFMTCPDVDGALVGGASLKPAAFAELCTQVANSSSK